MACWSGADSSTPVRNADRGARGARHSVVMRPTRAALAILLTAVLTVPMPTAASVAPAPDRRDSTERTAAASLRDRVIALTNKKRANHGCNRVRRNDALSRAAQKHSRRMGDYYAAGHSLDASVEHRLPGEPTLRRRVNKAGYRNWVLLGENIAAGQPTARAVMRSWMGSEGHKANILNCRFKDIGVGLVWADGVPFWTQDFGRK